MASPKQQLAGKLAKEILSRHEKVKLLDFAKKIQRLPCFYIYIFQNKN